MINTIEDFYPVLIFSVVAVVFTLSPVVISYLIAPRTRGKNTFATYECGIPPFGSAWTRHTVVYYVYALIFIAFDVDILYLFPVALSYTRGERMYEFFDRLISVALPRARDFRGVYDKGVYGRGN